MENKFRFAMPACLILDVSDRLAASQKNNGKEP